MKEYNEYLDMLGLDKSYNTIRYYKGTIGKFLDFYNIKNIGDVETLTSKDCREYLISLQKNGMKNSSINTNIRSVKVFFNWLVEQEYISANPFTKVKDLKTSKRKPEYLENEEVLSMIKACKNIQDKTIVAVLVSTGLRRNELVNIKLEDIHGDAIKIIGKGDKERVVYMQDDVFNLYQEYLIWREKNNKRKGITSEYLFVTKMNDKFSGDSIYLKIKSIARNAGLSEDRVEKIHPHMFRHTFATNLRESSGDIRIVQHSLGHSKLETTMIYDDVRDVSLRTAMLKQKAIV